MAGSAHRVAIALLALVAVRASGATLEVGPTRAYAVPSQAAAAAHDGDLVEIDAGLYSGDVCVWTANDLVIRGVGGFAHLDAAGQSAQGKSIWVIAGANTTVQWVEFSGCAVVDQNGAGIRQEGPGLTLQHCFFHDNQEGILTGDGATSDIVMESCEFARNGAGDGYSHNLYIGHVRSFAFRWSYSHDAIVGHELKSRALLNRIEYSRLTDEATGSASYTIDLPNGGESYLIGDLIEQGPQSQNSTIVAYAEEGGTNPVQELYVVGNTIVDDLDHGTFLSVAGGTAVSRITDNLFVGAGTVLSGPGTLSGNVVTDAPGFVDRAGYDYRLVAGSPAIDAGVDPGSAHGIALAPAWEYVHPLDRVARTTSGAAIDAGAYEYGSGGTTTGGTSAGGSTTAGTTAGGSTTGSASGGSTTGSTTGSASSSGSGHATCGHGAGFATAIAVGIALALRTAVRADRLTGVRVPTDPPP